MLGKQVIDSHLLELLQDDYGGIAIDCVVHPPIVDVVVGSMERANYFVPCALIDNETVVGHPAVRRAPWFFGMVRIKYAGLLLFSSKILCACMRDDLHLQNDAGTAATVGER